MYSELKRREFLQLTLAGSALSVAGPCVFARAASPAATRLVSPGCRRSKVKVARLYMCNQESPNALWPKPKLDLKAEAASYGPTFEAAKEEFADVDFVVFRENTEGAYVGMGGKEDGTTVYYLWGPWP